MRYRISLLTALACMIAGGCATGAPAAPPPPALAGMTALPQTRLELLDGATTDLASALAGQPALVSLWATWCESCLAEVSALKRLDAQTRSRGDARVVAVAVGEPRSRVAAFARDRTVHYELLVDPNFALADALGERRVPATLVVDRSGHIVYRGGALDGAGLAALRRATQVAR
jgi:peroxiredoxin